MAFDDDDDEAFRLEDEDNDDNEDLRWRFAACFFRVIFLIDDWRQH